MRNLLYIILVLPMLGISAEKLEQRVAELEQRVLELEHILISTDSIDILGADISSIRPGIYVLETHDIESISESESESGYVIYHVMTTVKSEENEYSIQFGVGRKGILKWQFYVDYNNDGTVDMEMIEEFLDSLPLMGVFSRSIDSNASQNVYQSLIRNINLANHTPPEEIAENAGTISRQIWDYVQTQSILMAKWIKQQYPESASEE